MKKYKILFIDDDHLVLRTAEIFLKSITTKLTLVCSGKECLQELHSDQDYDLILLDCMLPDMNGLDVLNEIRQHTKTKNIPVILQTGMLTVDDAKLTELDAGIIYKPYSKQDLHNIMQKYIPDN